MTYKESKYNTCSSTKLLWSARVKIDIKMNLYPFNIFLYFRGSNLQRRLADREVEEAADERDRQKEIEQLEIARRKVIEERDPNAESIILQMEQKMQEHRRKCLNLNENGSSGARYVAHNRQSPQNNSATNENSCEESPRTGFVEAIEENGHSVSLSSAQLTAFALAFNQRLFFSYFKEFTCR